MQLDIDGPTPEESPADEPERAGLASLIVDTIVRPTAAMRRLAAHPGRLWLAPVVALAVMSVAVVAVTLPARERYEQAAGQAQTRALAESNPQLFGGQDPEQLAQMTSSGPALAVSRVTAFLGALVAPFIAVLASAAVLHFLGTLLGGQQSYTQMLTVNSWARVPLVLQSGLRIVVWGVGGTYDPNPDGLAGLVAAAPTEAFPRPSPWGPVLSEVSVWNLWMLALMLIAVRTVCHVSWPKALVAMLAYVALVLLLGEAGVAIGRAVAGLGEGFAGG